LPKLPNVYCFGMGNTYLGSWQSTLVVLGLLSAASSAEAFQLGNRWSTTATNGGGLTQGDATTVTWGFVPDGTTIAGTAAAGEDPTETSSLLSALDTTFGGPTTAGDLTTAAWFSQFDSAYSRWGEVSGLTMAYSPTDDGVTMGASPFSGILGIRADMRIGGRSVDGSTGANTLAYNYLPNNGDHVQDTDNILGGTYSLTGIGSTRLRNVITHEAGHGLGFRHLESNNSNQLLEPFISTAFLGPQLDDILGIQRHYGDALEKSGGNDTVATATVLGSVASGMVLSVGTLGDSAVVANSATDFISIDGTTDTDLFAFTVGSQGFVSLTLDPRGATYNEGPQDGIQAPLITDQLSNLKIELIGTDGFTVLATASGSAAGITETVTSQGVSGAGTYYARVMEEAGADDDVQLYGLTVGFEAVPEPSSALLALLASAGLVFRRTRPSC